MGRQSGLLRGLRAEGPPARKACLIVLVDTTIWSLALRRRRGALSREEGVLVEEWAALVRSGRAALAGPIRQEVLSGIKSPEVFETMQEQLGKFRYMPILPSDYDQAARFFNQCRAAGIAATAIDMLLCALAHRFAAPIFTTDIDFQRYAECLAIRLYSPADDPVS